MALSLACSGSGVAHQGDQRLGLRIRYGASAFGVTIFLAGIDAVQECLAGGTGWRSTG